MRKSSWLFLLLAAAAIAILVYVFSSRPQRDGKATTASPSTASSALSSPRIPPDSLTGNRRLGTTSESAELRAGEADPELIGVSEVIRAYRAGVGENPIGTNAEITKALTGANSRKANFGGADLKIKDGQIVDRWEHPYFFHQLSGNEMEIRSAGPDGVMWTKDDEVIR